MPLLCGYYLLIKDRLAKTPDNRGFLFCQRILQPVFLCEGESIVWKIKLLFLKKPGLTFCSLGIMYKKSVDTCRKWRSLSNYEERMWIVIHILKAKNTDKRSYTQSYPHYPPKMTLFSVEKNEIDSNARFVVSDKFESNLVKINCQHWQRNFEEISDN